MKWVLKTSSIIVGTADGQAMFRSVKECPPAVRRLLHETLPSPNSCTIMITNRETLEAIRRRGRMPSRRGGPFRRPGAAPWHPLAMPRWQTLAGILLLLCVACTALLVWAVRTP